MGNDRIMDEIYHKFAEISQQAIHLWSEKIVFGWQWWFQIILTISSWALWIKYRDKSQTARLLLVGMIVAIINNFFDAIGLTLGLWHYDFLLLPIIISYIPWDYALFPVSIMFILQWKPNIKPIYKAIMTAFVYSFIFEPLFIWLKMYHILKWSIVYSFIIYIPLYLLYNHIYNSKFLFKDSGKN